MRKPHRTSTVLQAHIGIRRPHGDAPANPTGWTQGTGRTLMASAIRSPSAVEFGDGQDSRIEVLGFAEVHDQLRNLSDGAPATLSFDSAPR